MGDRNHGIRWRLYKPINKHNMVYELYWLRNLLFLFFPHAVWESSRSLSLRISIHRLTTMNSASRPPRLGRRFSFSWSFCLCQTIFSHVGIRRESPIHRILLDRPYNKTVWTLDSRVKRSRMSAQIWAHTYSPTSGIVRPWNWYTRQ